MQVTVLGDELGCLLAGIGVVRHSPLLDLLMPFFEMVRLPDANAWVMNMLVIAPTPQDGLKANGSAGQHFDDTLKLRRSGLYNTPYQTDVLYISVPKGMEGTCLLLSFLSFIAIAVGDVLLGMLRKSYN